jgi:DNA-binding transcriptional ArsR family regulator
MAVPLTMLRGMSASRQKSLDLLFGALAHPVRRSILDAVSKSDRTIVELAEPHHMSLNAVSKHIKKLESAGLIRRRVDGSFHRISMNRAAMKTGLRWMSRYVPFWRENLASLKTTLEKNR